MCILFLFTNPKPEVDTYRLILISNRDEYYVRPAQSIQNCDEEKLVGGFDMEPGREGGMWLGLSYKQNQGTKLRIGVLLNIAAESRNNVVCKNRGPIVRDYLAGNYEAEEYVNLMAQSGTYKPHHFVTVELGAELSRVTHTSNMPSALNKFSGSQCLGFGNSPVDSPYEKVRLGRQSFQKIVDSYNNKKQKEELVSQLLELLKWEQKHLPDAELEKRIKSGHEFLSSVFVNCPTFGYGTRAHSIILVDHDWNLEFIEVAMEQPIDANNPTWLANTVKLQL